MRDLRQADRRARRRAQEEFRRPLVLEAGAGTGKTTTLVARVLAWCLGPGWEKHGEKNPGEKQVEPMAPEKVAVAVLRRIVAITFTEAAAAEMAGRIAEELARVAAGECPVWLLTDGLPNPGERAVRARALAGALDHLTVRTIHAYCRRLLADHPLEAGLHPHFEVDATGLAVEQVCREVVELALRRAYGDPGDEAFLALAARGVGPESLVSALGEMVQQGLSPELLAQDPLAPEKVRDLLGRAAESLRKASRAAAPLAGVGARNKLTLEVVAALERSAGLFENLGDEAPLAAAAEDLPPLWPDNVLRRLQDWSSGRFNKGEQAVLGQGQPALAAAAGPALALLRHLIGMDPELLQAGRKALFPLLTEATETLRRRGVTTFSALLVEARNLLAHHAGVRRRLRRGLDQLLVDEFQDTDRLQCDLVRRLALTGPEEERPGLFLVGDPKQSIYGWRSADLVAYDGFLEEVRENGGEIHGLSENFRSVPAVLDEVERAIAPVMEEERGLQPPFQPLFACAAKAEDRGFETAGRRPLEAWISWGEDGAKTRTADAAALEAKAVARDLLELRRTGVAWRDVGLLLRSSGELDVYLEALRKAGIPFAVGRDKQYYQRREIIEAVALVRAVLDPGDQLALLTLLRSVMVGVPDAALLPLWSAGLPRRMIDLDREGFEAVEEIARRVAAGLPAGIPGLPRVAGWEENLVTAAAHLERLRRAFREESAARFVALLRRLFLQEPLESARYLGRYRIANLERFYRQLQEGLESGADVTSLLRFLRRSVAEATAAEEGRLLDSATDAVQVLTIHAAKGLGFEHVYLLQLHKADPPTGVPEIAFGKVGEGDEYTLFGAPTPGFDLLLEAERKREAAERVRLLYVAMTRAKRRLVLLGKWPETHRPGPVPAACSMLDLLAHRTSPDGEPAPTAGELFEAGSAEAEASGLRWVFPALATPRDEAGSLERTAANLPTVEEVRRGAERLEELRRRAEERMLRPLGGAPSGSPHEEAPEEAPEKAPDEAPEGRFADLPFGADLPEAARRVAMAAGTAVHRLLEDLDLAGDPEAELSRQLSRLEGYLPARLSADVRGHALSEARRLVGELSGSRLLSRLFELGEHVLARELPVLLPPLRDDGPLAFLSGVADLVYRDPVTGELVVADFKTDAVATPEAARARAASYAIQGSAYQRALEGAFGLDALPRFELWFLAADTVVEP